MLVSYITCIFTKFKNQIKCLDLRASTSVKPLVFIVSKRKTTSLKLILITMVATELMIKIEILLL
jgi:hypothetical protein